MEDYRYELHARFQKAMFNANAAYADLTVHHLAQSTFFTFIHKPEKSTERTLRAVELVCEFLEAAYASRLLPLTRDKLKQKPQIFKKLYETWWNNEKRFPTGTEVKITT